VEKAQIPVPTPLGACNWPPLIAGTGPVHSGTPSTASGSTASSRPSPPPLQYIFGGFQPDTKKDIILKAIDDIKGILGSTTGGLGVCWLPGGRTRHHIALAKHEHDIDSFWANIRRYKAHPEGVVVSGKRLWMGKSEPFEVLQRRYQVINAEVALRRVLAKRSLTLEVEASPPRGQGQGFVYLGFPSVRAFELPANQNVGQWKLDRILEHIPEATVEEFVREFERVEDEKRQRS